MDVPAQFISYMLGSYLKVNFPARVAEFAAETYEDIDKNEVYKLATEAMNNLKNIDFNRPKQIYKESRAEETRTEVRKMDSQVENSLMGKMTAHDYFLYNLSKSLEEEVKQLEKEVAELQDQTF
uniref:ING domain-containing protein n=1 Tax=Rhabditophanes sp. KR3021 TaxID=114890 RepID=A0AC35TGP4_9BILA